MREVAIVLPPQQRLLAFVVFCLLIVVLSSLGAFFLAPLWGLLLPLPLLVVGWFFRRMFIPGITGQTRVQLASLATLYATSVLYFLPSNPLTAIAIAVLNRWLHLELGDPLWYSLAAQSFVCLTIVSLNIAWRSRDISPVPQGAKDIVPDSDRTDFDRSLERYCKALVAELDRYDRDVNWSDRELTPLEAEVETERNSRMRPRIVKDLVAAIRRDRFSETFVVLGDPGSGKSVSLRRLVRELCQQAKITGVVPVYVNLREYPPNRQLTTEGLVEFIKEEAYRQTGRDGRSFLDTWYDQFRKNSQLFFVIDSFDELPSVLDCDDRSDAHKSTSRAFSRFFTQEIQSCRAVLSSRHFRAPVGVKGTRLMLRPFRESQIRQAMKTWLLGRRIDTDGYIRRLFREKPELVPALRNPFTAELISEYARSAGEEELPENLFAVFNHYIENRLAADRPKLRELNLTGEEVRKCAAIIAEKMYRSGTFGLEAEVKWVVEEALGEMGRDQAENVIEALRYSRIVRVGGRVNPRFSFVHRRFAEFFVVEAIRETANNFLNLEAIPTDSRWRDCLVMYCGIAKPSVRQYIAEYCWSVIDNNRDKFLNGDFNNARDVIHCLRFLTDAFRSDFSSIESFQLKLSNFIGQALRSQDILVSKIGAEVIHLINFSEQEFEIDIEFWIRSNWVCETVFNSCRHLGKERISQGIRLQILSYLFNISTIDFIKKFKELDFSMSLSEAFESVRLYLWLDLLEIMILTTNFTAIQVIHGIGIIFGIIDVGILFFSIAFFFGMGAFFHIQSPFRNLSWRKDPMISFVRQYCYLGQFVFVFPILSIISNYGINIFWVLPVAIILTLNACIIHFGCFELFLFLRKIQYLFYLKKKRKKIFFLLCTFLNWKKRIFLGFFVILFLSVYFLSISIPLNLDKDFLLYFSKSLSFRIFLGGILFWVGITIVNLFCVLSYHSIYSIIKQVLYDREKINLKRHKIPEKISSVNAYNICLSFKNLEIRQMYLQQLRLNYVKLDGEITEPPPELIKDKIVAEELARLREQWYGLAS